MKKRLVVLTCLMLIMLFIFPGMVSANATSQPFNVNQANAKVLVNGVLADFEAYNINGNNYFKLRDIAKVVSGTKKQFEVTWNEAKRAINLVSNSTYTPAGGELAKGDGKPKQAVLNSSVIYKDGSAVALMAYNIGGNNFFKLRDLTQAFNIGVTWDGATSTVGIDTAQDYIGEAAPAVVVEKPSVVNEPSYRIEAEDKNNNIVGFARKDRIQDDGGGEAIGYFQREGESITFNRCPSATSLTFRYANIIDTTGVMLYVDGKKIDTLIFPNTHGYNTYKEITFNADIPEEANVKFKLGTDGALNIDYIDFNGVCTLARDIVIEEVEVVEASEVVLIPGRTPGYTIHSPNSPIKASIRREAEDTRQVVIYGNTRTEGLSSGGTAVTYFEEKGESITFKNCPAASSISIRYATPKSTSNSYLYVNGKKVKTLGFKDSGDYYTYADYKVSVDIPKGANVKILLISSCTGINLDYIDFITE